MSSLPSDIFWRWAQEGKLRAIMPDLDALRGISQRPAHRDDAFVHTLKVVDAIEPTPIRRWAALLHDIAKAPTYIDAAEGRSRFFEHDRIGAVMVSEIVPAYEDDTALVEAVARLVRLHMRPISYTPEWSDSAVRRLVEDSEEDRGPEGWADLMALARADLRGYLPEPIDRGLWVLDSLEARYRALVEDERRETRAVAAGPRSPLDGRELQALADLEPGPWIGELKEYLRSEVEAGRLNPGDRESAEALAREWIRSELKVEG